MRGCVFFSACTTNEAIEKAAKAEFKWHKRTLRQIFLKSHRVLQIHKQTFMQTSFFLQAKSVSKDKRVKETGV